MTSASEGPSHGPESTAGERSEFFGEISVEGLALHLNGSVIAICCPQAGDRAGTVAFQIAIEIAARWNVVERLNNDASAMNEINYAKTC